MTRRIILASLLLAPALLVALAGCTVDAATPAATPTTSLPPQSAVNTTGSYQVTGGGTFASGEIVLCQISDPILIEDMAGITSDEIVPTTSMIFRDGVISYATIWPDDIVGVGVTSGEGTYTIEADDDGVPRALHATATVKYSEADGTVSDRNDTVDLVFTPVETPDYCTT